MKYKKTISQLHSLSRAGVAGGNTVKQTLINLDLMRAFIETAAASDHQQLASEAKVLLEKIDNGNSEF